MVTKFIRSVLIVATAGALSVSLTACSAGSADTGGSTASSASKGDRTPSPSPTPVSLDGKWKQTNSKSTDAWQAATISGNTIEIDWVTDNGDTTSLYWAGSVTPPTTPGGTFSWTSTNDTSKTGNALLASSDPTKDFSYDHGVISYSVSALGTTTTVKIARQN